LQPRFIVETLAVNRLDFGNHNAPIRRRFGVKIIVGNFFCLPVAQSPGAIEKRRSASIIRIASRLSRSIFVKKSWKTPDSVYTKFVFPENPESSVL
jgi:hypothetical protein